MINGWWSLTITGDASVKQLSDVTLEHIAEQIKEGMIEGQIVEYEEGDDD